MIVVLFKPVRLAASARDSIGAAHGCGVRYAQCSAESVSESLMQIKHLPAGAKNLRTVAINFACDRLRRQSLLNPKEKRFRWLFIRPLRPARSTAEMWTNKIGRGTERPMQSRRRHACALAGRRYAVLASVCWPA